MAKEMARKTRTGLSVIETRHYCPIQPEHHPIIVSQPPQPVPWIIYSEDGHFEGSLKESPEPPAARVLRIAGLGGKFPEHFGHTCIRNSETIQHWHEAQGLRNSAQLHGSRIYTVIYCAYRDETWDEMSEGEDMPVSDSRGIVYPHYNTGDNNPIDE